MSDSQTGTQDQAPRDDGAGAMANLGAPSATCSSARSVLVMFTCCFLVFLAANWSTMKSSEGDFQRFEFVVVVGGMTLLFLTVIRIVKKGSSRVHVCPGGVIWENKTVSLPIVWDNISACVAVRADRKLTRGPRGSADRMVKTILLIHVKLPSQTLSIDEEHYKNFPTFLLALKNACVERGVSWKEIDAV